MQRDRIKTLLAQGTAGQAATVCGWVRTKRESKEVAFLAVNDGSSQDHLQLVVAMNSPVAALLPCLGTGAALLVRGTLRESPAAGQKWEVAVSELEIFGEADAQTYPLQKKGHTLEFLREIGHLRPRTNTLGAVFRVRNTLAFAVHEFFQSRGFV